MSESIDVVVVGAGLSGLVAARELTRRGLRVTVLESADRVGGRSLSETSALGSRVDLGGQWIGRGHHNLTELADEYGLTAYPMHTGLLPKLVDGGRRIRLVAPSALMSLLALGFVELLSRLHPRRRWDTTPAQAWLDRVPGPTARRLLEVTALISWTADLDRFSVRTMLRMIRAQGGVLTMLSTKGGAQEGLFVEGAGTLAELIAAELGAVVRTGQRVTGIRRDDDCVTVRTATQELRAARVIVAVPPPVAAHIAHEPALPADRTALQDETFMGTVYKAVAVYPEPFWRARRGGEFLSIAHPGLVVFDTTPPDGPGHLCFLVSGDDARALDRLDETQRRRAVLGSLVAHLGEGALEPVGWHEKSWHLDEHAGGGYMAVAELGATAGLLPMPAAPVGRVHWAGSESATGHPGYLDGAIEAGRRAAAEVAQAAASHG